MEVLNLDDGLLALLRRSPDGREAIVALHNVTAGRRRAVLDLKEPRLQPLQVCRDILSEKDYQPGARRLLTLELGPYQASRLKAGGLLP